MELSHAVSPLRQPTLNDCWATCAAMVLRISGNDAVDQIKRRAASVTLNRNGSLPPSSVPQLSSTLHLHLQNLAHPPQELSVRHLTVALRSSCAAAFGEFNYPGVPTSRQHVLLIYRATGNDQNPMVHFVDPYTARRYNYLVSEFNESLGSIDYLMGR